MRGWPSELPKPAVDAGEMWKGIGVVGAIFPLLPVAEESIDDILY